ncbi:hypothetical protein ANN_01022 [Periplaneta americana]|uniref:Uncharacterized protein n=1 Tax=Periplaneta americana TaxID=6978 RepID=A0ABQ8TSF2_PERAM|nr:hypothetical protein ANN_01022 [Periplaneta americana]
MSPESSTDSYPAFAYVELRENPRKNLNQASKLDVSPLAALGYDGASTNTGRKNGSMVCIEKEIGRSLQRIICLLHVNELRHRYLMKHLAGITTGPETRSGHIGEELLHFHDYQPDITLSEGSLVNTESTFILQDGRTVVRRAVWLQEGKRYERCNWTATDNQRKILREKNKEVYVAFVDLKKVLTQWIEIN